MDVAKLGPVGSDFRQQGVGGERIEGGHRRQVHTPDAIQFTAHIKAKLVLTGGRVTLWRQLWGIGRKLAVKVLQSFLDFLVAGGDRVLVVTIRFQGLTYPKKMSPPIV